MMTTTIRLPPIVEFDTSEASIEAIADWHAENAEAAENGARRLRHEVIEFRLRKLAHGLRLHARASEKAVAA